MAKAEKTASRELVTNAEKSVIDALHVLGETTSNEVAENVEVGQRHVRGCVNKLNERGFVETRQSPEDGRVFIHRLSDGTGPADFISNRENGTREPAEFFTDSTGYEHSRSYYRGEYDDVLIHRLVAVAEYGYKAVAGHEVHHLKAVPWANWGENLVPLTKTNHMNDEADRDVLDALIARLSTDELREGLERAGQFDAATLSNRFLKLSFSTTFEGATPTFRWCSPVTHVNRHFPYV